jgi:hypothetical protein
VGNLIENIFKAEGENDKQKKGTPGNNQAQNKQVNDIVNKHDLTKEQRSKLHGEISGQNYGYHEIDEIAREIKAGRW